MKNRNILVVDDTEMNIDVLVELLDDKYEVSVALDGKSALEVVAQEKINLILLDIMMPNMDGYEVCKVLKENEQTKDIPIIFLTAKADEDSIEKAYDMGGIDYVSKPFKPKELMARIKTVLQLQSLILELKASKEELKLLSSIDPMTQLYNRRYFSKISKHILDLSKREKTKLSLLMIDIDNFKKINDTYGHQVGDDVIISLAKKLEKYTRASDIICRFGGEEFVILLPETSIDGATIISEKIREVISDEVINFSHKEKLKFTISIGLTQIKNETDMNIDVLINRADKALYDAKNSGKNKVCIR